MPSAKPKPKARQRPRPDTYLQKVLDLVGMIPAELARQLDTTRQQVSKWVNEGRKISPTWAKKMEPILGVEWPYLVEGELPPYLQPGSDQDQLLHQQFLVLKRIWGDLRPDERNAIVATADALTAPRRKSA